MNTALFRKFVLLTLITLLIGCLAAIRNSGNALAISQDRRQTTPLNSRPSGIDIDVTYLSREPRYAWDEAKQWPDVGEKVTFTAHVINKGTQQSGAFTYQWLIDGAKVGMGEMESLMPDEEGTTIIEWLWQNGRHTVEFIADPENQVAESFEQNNSIEDATDALTVAFWVEDNVYDVYNSYSNSSGTYSWEDWAQDIIQEMNQMFGKSRYPAAPSGAKVRVRLDKITKVPDMTLNLCPDCNHAPDEKTTDVQWGFGMREGYHNPPGSAGFGIAWWIIHELGHYLFGLVDLYALDVDYWDVLILDDYGHEVAGTSLMPFAAGSPEIVRYASRTYDIMRVPSPGSLYSDHTVYALNRYWPMGSRTRQGFGRYILELPQETRLRVLDGDGKPMPGVHVSVYQTTAGSDPFPYDQEFDNAPDIVGLTNEEGQFSLGHNPFPGGLQNSFGDGEIKLGLLLLKLEDPSSGEIGFAWLEIVDMNIGCWLGDCELYTHDLYFPSGQGKLHVSADVLTFKASRHEPQPPPQTIRVAYGGDPINHWSLSEPTVPWLRTIPEGKFDDLYPPGPLTFIVDSSGLEPGLYTTALSISTWNDNSIADRTITVELAVQNNPPEAEADEYEFPRKGTLTVAAPGVLGNDVDPDGDPLSTRLITDTQHGVLHLNGDGSFTYKPSGGFVGHDSFQYRATDRFANSNTVTVELKLRNNPPEAEADVYGLLAHDKLTVAAPGVLGNDIDPDGDSLSTRLITDTQHGVLHLNDNGSFTYKPSNGFLGHDSFQYQASDGISSSATTSVLLTVMPHTSMMSVILAP